jgi:hypothetical protein
LSKPNYDLKQDKDSITLLDSAFVKNSIKIYWIRRYVQRQKRRPKRPLAQVCGLEGNQVVCGNFQSDPGAKSGNNGDDGGDDNTIQSILTLSYKDMLNTVAQ